MITMKLPGPLARLAGSGDDGQEVVRSVVLRATTWPECARELRERYPAMAERVVSPSGGIATGFVLVVNGEVQAQDGEPQVQDGDELALVAMLAGG